MMELAVDFTLAEVQQFLFDEARLLDGSQYEEWLDLFVPHGIYWIPSVRGQTDPLNVPSIVYENRDLLAMRVSRLAHPGTYVARPRPYTTHLVGNVSIGSESGSAPVCEARSVVFVHLYRDGDYRLFSGECRHVLCRVDGRLRIVSKRIDLVDCDAVQSAFMSLL